MSGLMTTVSQRDEVANLHFNGRTVNVAYANYNFTDDGGLVSTIDLFELVPLGAIITKCVTDTPTNLTSGGSATVQILVGAQSVVAAAAFDTGYDAVTTHALATAEGIKVTTAANVKIAIATAALTAGNLNIWIEYYLPGSN